MTEMANYKYPTKGMVEFLRSAVSVFAVIVVHTSGPWRVHDSGLRLASIISFSTLFCLLEVDAILSSCLANDFVVRFGVCSKPPHHVKSALTYSPFFCCILFIVVTFSVRLRVVVSELTNGLCLVVCVCRRG